MHLGAVTGSNRYDAIIFNNPYLVGGSQTASLIAHFKQSARGQLSPGGEIHINVTQQLLLEHTDVAFALGLPNNHNSTVRNLPIFATSPYYAPYIPQYSTGDDFRFWPPERSATLKNFVFR